MPNNVTFSVLRGNNFSSCWPRILVGIQCQSVGQENLIKILSTFPLLFLNFVFTDFPRENFSWEKKPDWHIHKKLKEKKQKFQWNEKRSNVALWYNSRRRWGKKTVWGKRQEKFWSTLENLRWKENNQIMWVMAVLSNHIHLWQNCWHKQKKRIVKEAKTFAIKKRRVFFVFATPTHRWRAYIKLENRVRSNSTTIHTSTSLVL